MSLYNALFGVNKLAPLLLKILDIDQKDGKWSSGRFRDIYFSEDKNKIILYTRNGGGNREHWDDEKQEGDNCHCTGCTICHDLPKHPNYISDYDDDFDCTYAYIEFSFPKEFINECKELAEGQVPRNPNKAWEVLLQDMEKGKETEETKKAVQVGKKIFGALEKKEKIITIEEKDGEVKKTN